MKMEVAVCAKTITLYALDMVKSEPNPVDIITSANKREIFALARANIQSFGRDTALQNVASAISVADIQRAEEHVRAVFPELR